MEFEGRKAAVADLNFLPLIDVVFLLLIFFMLTSTMVSEEGLEVSLPGSSSASTLPESPLSITLKKSGEIFVNAKPASIESLDNTLKNFLKDKTDTPILLRSDSGVSVQKLVTVMDSIRKQGGNNISVATQGEQ